MITYTLDEIRELVKIYQEEFPLDDPAIQAQTENYDFSVVFAGIINMEGSDPRKVLLEFIDNRDFVSINDDDQKLLLNMLFEYDLIEMPKFINYSDTEAWKSKVARWRLKLGK